MLRRGTHQGPILCSCWHSPPPPPPQHCQTLGYWGSSGVAVHVRFGFLTQFAGSFHKVCQELRAFQWNSVGSDSIARCIYPFYGWIYPFLVGFIPFFTGFAHFWLYLPLFWLDL